MRFTPIDVYELQQPDDAGSTRKAVGGSKMNKAKLIVALTILAMPFLVFAPAVQAQCTRCCFQYPNLTLTPATAAEGQPVMVTTVLQNCLPYAVGNYRENKREAWRGVRVIRRGLLDECLRSSFPEPYCLVHICSPEVPRNLSGNRVLE
jgi:hypothetical protein